ncbi:hypothetical protein Pint_25952 [Pistacia integerrima]|uniref:Uncharacterized protein n=1 Tax=Pistacia integerrima TaxID=434235 RepID=A0ACC0YE28_9ROSI|nr:hypothetical protein Pint_25952 [Pistacia integerrima]
MALFAGQAEGHDFDKIKHGSAFVSVAELEQKGSEIDDVVKGILRPDFGPLNNGSASVPVAQMVLFEQNGGEADREGVKSVQEPDSDQLNPGSASFRVAQMALFEQKGDEADKEMNRSQVHDFHQLNHGSAPAPVPVAVPGVLVPSSPGHAVSESPGLSSVTEAQVRTDAMSAVATLSSSTNTNGEVRIHVPNSKFVKTEPPLLNSRQMTKLCLVIVAQVALTLTTIGTTDSSHVSPYAEILLYIAKICNLTAFICFLNVILICSHNNPGVAATILKGIGIIATTYGLLAVLCMELLDKVAIQLWVTIAIFLLCIPASIAAFRA